MDEDLKSWLHEAAGLSPLSWYMNACALKAAAERLDPISMPVQEEEPVVSFMPQYCMLLGMAFESLLKGLFVRNVATFAFHHRLDELASDPALSTISFSHAEIELLKLLSMFVIWGGRYPTAKKATDYAALAYGSRERALEAPLWAKLAEPLCATGWLQKGPIGGPTSFRLFADGSRKP